MKAHELCALAGLPLSLAQLVILKAVEGVPLNRTERAMLRRLTGAGLLGKANPAGYRECYVRCGRRSGKSTRVAAPLAVAALLRDVDHLLAPGEQARVLLIAPRRDQTRILLDSVSGLLDLLGVAHEKLASGIRVEGLRTSVEVTTADGVAPRGPTSVCVVIDEAAMLPYLAGSAGQDRELIASAKPTLATTGGTLIVLSTPLGREGVHYERVEALHGQLDGRGVAFVAATWVMNPDKFPDEASTRVLEEDDRVWRREYAAIPGEADNSAFAADDIECCVDRGRRYNDAVPGLRYAVGFDEGGRRAARALIVAHRELRHAPAGHQEVTVVDFVRRWPPGQQVDHDAVMRDVAAIAKRYNGATVVRDNFAGDAVASALARHETASNEVSMSSSAQAERFRDLQRLVESHRLRLPEDEQLLREMRGLRETLHQGGRVAFAKGNGKGEFDDLVDALALATAKAAKLPPGGGDIVILKPAEFYWKREAPRSYVPAVYGRRLPNGQIVPCQPPPGPDADIARQERFAQGCFTPEDEVLLGREEIDRRMQAGGTAPSAPRPRSLSIRVR
jgi:hypothetical protein